MCGGKEMTIYAAERHTAHSFSTKNKMKKKKKHSFALEKIQRYRQQERIKTIRNHNQQIDMTYCVGCCGT